MAAASPSFETELELASFELLLLLLLLISMAELFNECIVVASLIAGIPLMKGSDEQIDCFMKF